MYPDYKISLLFMPTPPQYLMLLTFAISHEVFLNGWRLERGVAISNYNHDVDKKNEKEGPVLCNRVLFSMCLTFNDNER